MRRIRGIYEKSCAEEFVNLDERNTPIEEHNLKKKVSTRKSRTFK